MRTARRLLREGRFDEAREAFARREGEASAPLGLGYLALLRNDLDEAEQCLRAAVQRPLRRKTARALLGEVHYRRDDFERAAPLFAAAGQAAKARKLASFTGRRPNEIQPGFADARIPFAKTDPLPVIELSVNGSAPGRFIIDTGGGELILDRTFARKVGAETFGGQRSVFGGGRKATLEHASVESVQLGEASLANVPVSLLDLEGVGPQLGEERLDGILGTVPLYHFLSTIDYVNGELVLQPRGSEARGVAVPFWLAEDHFMVAWGTLNGGRPMLFFVDTGLAGAGFTGPQSTLRHAGVVLEPEGAVNGVGGGGAFSAVPFDVGELSLGEVSHEHLPGVDGAFPKQIERAMGFRIGGLISHQFFRSHALTLDFAAMRLRIA